jgi:hypothetical protein
MDINMDTIEQIEGTEAAWEAGLLGASAAHIAPASAEMDAAIDSALGMQAISIRLPKQLVDAYRLISAHHGIGYQPLMRDILQRWVKEGLKEVYEHQAQKSDEAEIRIEEMRKVA